MGLCLRDNQRLFRAQAALMAALYVLLCTFGAITHIHTAPIRSASPAVSERASTAVLTAPREGERTPTAQCSYCEWQASSVSTALPSQTLSAPLLVDFSTEFRTQTVTSFDPPQSSSRAPPLS